MREPVPCCRRYYQRTERDTPWLRQRFVIDKEVSEGRVGDVYDASEVQVMRKSCYRQLTPNMPRRKAGANSPHRAWHLHT